MAFNQMFDYTRLGQVFHTHTQTAQTLSTLSTTAVGLILSNPYGSGKNLALLDVHFSFTTAPAGASVVGLAISPLPSATAVVHTTPATIYAGHTYGAATNSVAKADTAATTVGTPVYIRTLGGNVAASGITTPYIFDRVDGSIILVPGTSIQLSYITTAAVGLASYSWLEYIPSTTE